MADQITKIIIRRGTDSQRRTSGGTGVNFNVSEPAFCVDTQRLYIGNGSVGGIPAGTRNLGSVNQLFGSDIDGYTFEGYNRLTLSGAEMGDFIYDKTTRAIYSLSGRSSFPPTPNDFAKFDSLTLVDGNAFYYDSNLILYLKDNGVTLPKVNSNVFDGVTITKAGTLDPVTLQTGSASTGILNTHFQYYPANTVILNSENSSAGPVYCTVGTNQVLGRTTTSKLTAINFSQVVANGIFSSNGIQLNQVGANFIVSLSSAAFSVSPSVTQINNDFEADGNTTLNGPVNINNYTNIYGNLFVQGTFQANGTIFSQGDIVAYFTSDKTLKDNIETISKPLNKIKNLNGVTFDWSSKSDYTGKDVGVIAQDVEQVLPQAVAVRKNGVKAVNYDKLIPLLIEGIKELSNRIEKLEK